MRIYTKTGDKGMTKLVGGASVSKDSDRVEAYGTIDELNSWIGYIISQLNTEEMGIKPELILLQNYLFDCGTDLATPVEANRPTTLSTEVITWMEERIDFYTDACPDIQRFILPGGTSTASLLHVARTIARRAERLVVHTNWTVDITPTILLFLNRLSDYFYAIARYINVLHHVDDIFYERSPEVFHKIKQDGL